MASCCVRKSDKGELSTCRHGRPQVTCLLLYKSTLFLFFGLILWKWMNGVESTDSNQECKISFKTLTNGVSQYLAYTRKLGNCRSSEGLRSFKPSNGTNLITLLILAGDIEMSPGPRFQCRLCKKYSKASDKVIKCEDCEKRFHASCSKLGDSELLKLKSGNGSWYIYCTNCKADCGLCSGTVLKDHKAVQCDSCEMWVYNGCSFITESQYEILQNTTVPGFAQNVNFSTFPILFLMIS